MGNRDGEAPPEDGKTVPAKLYDDTYVYELKVGGAKPEVVSRRKHGMGVCPVVRFTPDIDLEGRVTGIVEPIIPIQDRVNQSVFDLLVAQTFGSFKVRTIAGMAPPIELDADGKPVLRLIPTTRQASLFEYPSCMRRKYSSRSCRSFLRPRLTVRSRILKSIASPELGCCDDH
ncbi:phage portal protein [Streptomyces atratus]|uniref:phage portal protein n=1 Tax=Streptomyces atratus TaxID=1893 RepID=UPI0036596DF5